MGSQNQISGKENSKGVLIPLKSFSCAYWLQSFLSNIYIPMIIISKCPFKSFVTELLKHEHQYNYILSIRVKGFLSFKKFQDMCSSKWQQSQRILHIVYIGSRYHL